MDFSGKTVLITGASQGIGRATAVAFAQAGARVAINYNRQQAMADQVRNSLAGTGHIVVRANIADPVAVEYLVAGVVEQFGQIDILVNNAGIYRDHPLGQVGYQGWQSAWQEIIDVNLRGTANVSYCAARHMIERRQGRIINVSSRGAFRGEPTAPAYGASKAGINALSQSLAQYLAPHNVFVSVVAPGWIETDRTRPILETPEGAERRRQSPLNRVGRPEEVAHTILFLASDKSEFLTGAIVDINGASYLRS